MSKTTKNRGVTLVELLIVIVIIGIIASIAIIKYANVLENARAAEAYAVLAEIVASEKRYYLDNNTYTTSIPSLDTFESNPSDTSDNFNFTVPSTNVDSGYAQATSKVGGSNYWMCLKNAKKGSGSSSCN